MMMTISLQDNVTFQKIIDSGELPTVVSSTVEITERLRRHKNKRPDNWTDIADHFITCGKYRSTIKQFNLTAINPSNEHWRKILSRWKKELINNKKITGRRAPVYGTAIDDELADIVRRYNTKHGVPIGDNILRCSLILILEKEGRQDILNRILPDDQEITNYKQLRFGPEWARRFYKRHSLTSTVATTKMSGLEAQSDAEAMEDSSSDEEDEVEEEREAVVQPNVCKRKPSTMNGSIKKGKCGTVDR